MKRLLKTGSFLLSVIFLAMILTTFVSAEQDGTTLDHTALTLMKYWSPADDDHLYNLYRLPGIVVTKQDTIIIYGEGRKIFVNRDDSNGDKCEMDLYVRRSTDGGATFGSPIYIAKGEEYYNNNLGETIDNPVMIVGSDGRLHLLYCCDVGAHGLFYTYSDDDGLTWSTPRDLRDELETNISWSMLAFGPGHGVCMQSGRLVVPAWAYYGGSYAVYTVYSDDNGTSWHYGKRASNNRDETAIATTSDGGVLLNSRQYSTPNASSPYRMLTSSLDGSTSWSNSTPHTQLIDPACCGGMCSVDIEGIPHAILFTNNASTTSRDHITVRCSFDDGLTWEKSLLIDASRGGYSDVAVDSKGKVYVIYETDMGSVDYLATFSFWDVFCSGDETLVSEVTELSSFENSVSDGKNVTVTFGDNGEADFRVTRAGEASATISLTGTTKALKADTTPVVAVTVRANGTQTGEQIKCGAYLHCGRVGKSISALYRSFTFANDGKDHTVLLDYSDLPLCLGNLYEVALEFFSLEADAEAGDGYVISKISFFETVRQAQEVYPPEEETTTAEDETTQPDATVTTDAAESGSAGCHSSVASAIAPVIFVSIPAVLCGRKREKGSKNAEKRKT